MRRERQTLWRCKLCGWANAEDANKCISCGKQKKRAKKAALPRSREAARCIVLALDTANTSGWAVWICGQLHNHGQHALYSDAGIAKTQTLMRELQSLSTITGLPIACMSERSWGGHMDRGDTKAFGYWVYALRCIGVSIKRILQVYPSQWRAVVLSGGVGLKRDAVRALELECARSIVGTEVGDDEAAAICIGVYAAHCGELVASL